MLELLVSIPLDTLKKSREGLLLLLSEEGFILLDILFKHLLCNLCLVLLHLLSLELEELGLLVPLREGKFFSLIQEFHKLSRVGSFLTSFSSYTLMKLLDF